MLLAVATPSGCARWSHADLGEPRPTRSVPHDTVTDSRLGAELVVTATVTRLITINTFVLHDADLPTHGLLVVGADPGGLHQDDLVTVRGRVELFVFRAFAPKYGLSVAAPYVPFQGRRILVAIDVRSWA
jgi:hypothetical protein